MTSSMCVLYVQTLHGSWCRKLLRYDVNKPAHHFYQTLSNADNKCLRGMRGVSIVCLILSHISLLNQRVLSFPPVLTLNSGFNLMTGTDTPSQLGPTAPNKEEWQNTMLVPKGLYNKTSACQWFANCNTSTEEKPRSNWSSPSSLLQNDGKKGKPLGSYSSNLPLHAVFLRRFSCCLCANGIINETFDVKQILELVGRAAFKHFIFRTKSVWVETPVDQRLPQILKEREIYSKSIVKLNGLQITASSYVWMRAVELFEWTGKRATVNSWSSSSLFVLEKS